jgi:uncharacterized protein (DUF885 family)
MQTSNIRIFLLLILVCLACSSISNAGTGSVNIADSTALRQIFIDYHEELLRLDPISASSSGDHRYDDQLADDLSAGYIKKRKAFDRSYLKRLSDIRIDQISTSDKISLQVLQKMLLFDLERLDLPFDLMPINQFYCFPLSFAQMGAGSGGQRFENITDYQNWMKRMKEYERWTTTAINNMRIGMAKGITVPRVLIERTIPLLQPLANPDTSNIFFGPLQHLPKGLSNTERERLASSFKRELQLHIFPAYQRLLDFLQDEYLAKASPKSGLSAIPMGKEMYDYYLRYYTTTTLSPESIYQTGLKEVERIRLKMDSLKNVTGFRGDLNEFFNYLRTDRKFMPFKTADEVLNAYREVEKKVSLHLHDYFGNLPSAAFEIRRVEAFREAGQNGPSYVLGTPDGSRPGILYVPAPNPASINVTFMGLEATFIHEAIPGHHFQVALQMENKSLPEFRREVSQLAFFEGWALYVESFGRALGCYTDPYQQMGALNNELHRAIRLVVDVGLHTGKMSREEAIAYMVRTESITSEDATLSAERYMALPGQALSYTTGYLELLKIRSKCQKILQDKFVIRSFHDALLKEGDMPLSILEDYMTQWALKQL